MGWALWGIEQRAVTARLHSRFLKPVAVGSAIVVRGWVTRRRGRLVRAEARVEFTDGAVAADAKGLFILMGPAAE